MMNKNYNYLVEKVKGRTNPDALNESVIMDKNFSEGLRGLSDKKVLEYIKRSMRGVEPRYTELTFQAGNNVMEHLKRVNSSLSYKYQGSVMCNTHIYGHSDIDLVQISNDFYTHEPLTNFSSAMRTRYLTESQKSRVLSIINGTAYTGLPTYTLKKIRKDAELVLTTNYKNVDINKGKAIEVMPTSPKRKIDVVTASWYKNVDSVIIGDEENQGIQIYDKIEDVRLKVDYPFLKIKLLNEKSLLDSGRLKKMIRFLKNLKADSEFNLKALTSFDISSICYNIERSTYYDKSYFELVFVLYAELIRIVRDEVYRNSITSIDGSEPIFKDKPEKTQALNKLLEELNSVQVDLLKNVPIQRIL